MICSKCNAVNADGVKFCENCGSPLEMQHSQQQQAAMQYVEPQQDAVQHTQPQPQQAATQNMQPQPQDKHAIIRHHRVFALLRLLWFPLLIVMFIESMITGAVFGQFAADFVYVGWKYLGIVWSLASLFIAIRAKILHYPEAGFSVVISVLGLCSAITVNLVMAVLEFLGANF